MRLRAALEAADVEVPSVAIDYNHLAGRFTVAPEGETPADGEGAGRAPSLGAENRGLHAQLAAARDEREGWRRAHQRACDARDAHHGGPR